MKSLKAAVITFPGSNCDDDCAFVLEKVCEFTVDRLWHKDTPDLASYDLLVLPGGFSYGDYLRCGAIAGLSPIMEQVKTFANDGGMVLGTCNGFQILCEAGLLPGALAKNLSLNFVCKDVGLQVCTEKSPWTSDLKKAEVINLPIAHGDGRYIISEPEYQELVKNDQVLLKYTDNPNGSAFDIAGICNRAKNVFGLMPHPERASDSRTRDGMKIWKSVTKLLHERKS